MHILLNGSQYNAAPLKSFALAMISRNVEQVMRTNGWKELILSDQVHPEVLLSFLNCQAPLVPILFPLNPILITKYKIGTSVLFILLGFTHRGV